MNIAPLSPQPLTHVDPDGTLPGHLVAGVEGREPRERESRDARDSRERRHVLLVIGDQTKATYPLPDVGTVSIGRAQQNDVCVDDPAISRRHAILHLGATLRVEDLGSANGTRVCDAKVFGPRPTEMLKTAEILDRKVPSGGFLDVQPGNVIQVGSTILVVQRGGTSSRPRRLWPHGYFEGCLEEECARAERADAQSATTGRARASFGVLRVHVGSATPGRAVEEVLSIATRSVDVVANYGPGEYEILAIDADGSKIDDIRRRVIGFLAERGVTAKVGVASWPQDGKSPETLLAKACARAFGETSESEGGGPSAVVVADPAMQRLHRLAERIADSGISVLLLGETGVGKEILAEIIHRHSSRRDKPFLRLNCAALSESLLESELFGHERGSFTGAVAAKQGLLESADGGTVFLDEVGELPLSTQVKLLRVLEARQVTRVGSVKSKPIDVRFVAATNRDLEHEIQLGNFREDLFFRLNGMPLLIPPLRERVVEIEPMARNLLAQACRRAGREMPPLGADALDVLRAYSWPGNIRELRNVIERALLLCGAGPIGVDHLPVEKMGATLPARGHRGGMPTSQAAAPLSASGPTTSTAPAGAQATPSSLPPPSATWPASTPTLAPPRTATFDPRQSVEPGRGLRSGVEQVERDLILKALEQCAGNQTQAAKLLGISRRTLVSRLEQYELPRPRKHNPQRPM